MRLGRKTVRGCYLEPHSKLGAPAAAVRSQRWADVIPHLFGAGVGQLQYPSTPGEGSDRPSIQWRAPCITRPHPAGDDIRSPLRALAQALQKCTSKSGDTNHLWTYLSSNPLCCGISTGGHFCCRWVPHEIIRWHSHLIMLQNDDGEAEHAP
jgi:hypothetical protein